MECRGGVKVKTKRLMMKILMLTVLVMLVIAIFVNTRELSDDESWISKPIGNMKVYIYASCFKNDIIWEENMISSRVSEDFLKNIYCHFVHGSRLMMDLTQGLKA